MKIFCGQPLIYWTIKVALDSGWGRVCVSTDSDEIADYARSLNVEVPFIRPENLAMDTTPTEPVLLHALTHYGVDNVNYLLLLQPTSPFRNVQDIIEAQNIMASDQKCSCVFSVREAIANQNPDWMININNEGQLQRFNGKLLSEHWGRRQDLSKTYIRNDYVYMFKKDNLLGNNPNLYGSTPQLLISNIDRVDIDINNPVDWKIAESMFSKEAGV